MRPEKARREDLALCGGDLLEEKENYVVLVGRKVKLGGRIRERYDQAENETYYMNGKNHMKSKLKIWKIRSFETSDCGE